MDAGRSRSWHASAYAFATAAAIRFLSRDSDEDEDSDDGSWRWGAADFGGEDTTDTAPEPPRTPEQPTVVVSRVTPSKGTTRE